MEQVHLTTCYYNIIKNIVLFARCKEFSRFTQSDLNGEREHNSSAEKKLLLIRYVIKNTWQENDNTGEATQVLYETEMMQQ
jgi:hypothetical protein